MGRKKKTEQVESRAYNDSIYQADNNTTAFNTLTRSFSWYSYSGGVDWIDDLTITANTNYNWIRIGNKIFMKINEQPLNGSYVCIYKFHAFNSWYYAKGNNWLNGLISERIPKDRAIYSHQLGEEIMKKIPYKYEWVSFNFAHSFSLTSQIPAKSYFVFSTESGYRFYPLLCKDNNTITFTISGGGSSYNFQYAKSPTTGSQNVTADMYQCDNANQIGVSGNKTKQVYPPLQGTSLSFDGKDIGYFNQTEISNATWGVASHYTAGSGSQGHSFTTYRIVLNIGGKRFESRRERESVPKIILSWNSGGNYSSTYNNSWQTLNEMVNSYNYSNKFIGWYMGPPLTAFPSNTIKSQVVNIQTMNGGDVSGENRATLMYLDIPIQGMPMTVSNPTIPSTQYDEIGGAFNTFINPKTPVHVFPRNGSQYVTFNGGFNLVTFNNQSPTSSDVNGFNPFEEVWNFGGQLPVLTSEYAKFVGQNMNSTQANLQNAKLALSTAFTDGFFGTLAGNVIGGAMGSEAAGTIGGLFGGFAGLIRAGANIQKTHNTERARYKDALNSSKMNLTDVTIYDSVIMMKNLNSSNDDQFYIIRQSPYDWTSLQEWYALNGVSRMVKFDSSNNTSFGNGYYQFQAKGMMKVLMDNNNSNFTFNQISDLAEVLMNGVYYV